MRYIDKLNIPDSAFEFRTFEEKERNWKEFEIIVGRTLNDTFLY